MELQGKRVAILVGDNYEALEVWYPNQRLHGAGAAVTLVGSHAQSDTSRHGPPVQEQMNADQVQAKDFDALLIPSGSAADVISEQPRMLALIYEAIHQGKLLAMMGNAGQPSAQSSDGIQKHRVELCGTQPKRFNERSQETDSSVIWEDNLIQARTSADLPAFCHLIIAALSMAQPPAPTSVYHG